MLGLAFASGSLWVANADQQQVTRVEADADPIPIEVDARPNALAAAPGADAVWVAAQTQGGGGLLTRIDTGTNEVGRELRLRHAPTGLTVTSDARTVWLATGGDRVLHRVDASTGGVVGQIHLSQAPGPLAFGADRVWVANREDGTVSMIDPQRNEVGTLHLGFRPVAVAVEQREVWVALAA